MAVAGTRVKRFLQPGGANAVFARKRGMVAPPPLKETRQASKPKSRFGKASGQDYADFFSNPRNVNAIRSSIASLKNILVEGFVAAKSLRTTVGNMIKQIQSTGSGGGGGAGGFGGLLCFFASGFPFGKACGLPLFFYLDNLHIHFRRNWCCFFNLMDGFLF